MAAQLENSFRNIVRINYPLLIEALGGQEKVLQFDKIACDSPRKITKAKITSDRMRGVDEHGHGFIVLCYRVRDLDPEFCVLFQENGEWTCSPSKELAFGVDRFSEKAPISEKAPRVITLRNPQSRHYEESILDRISRLIRKEIVGAVWKWHTNGDTIQYVEHIPEKRQADVSLYKPFK